MIRVYLKSLKIDPVYKFENYLKLTLSVVPKLVHLPLKKTVVMVSKSPCNKGGKTYNRFFIKYYTKFFDTDNFKIISAISQYVDDDLEVYTV